MLYHVTDDHPGGGAHHHPHKKTILVLGVRVRGGDLERKYRFRITRNGELIQDELVLHSMKRKVHENVTRVDKGDECGLSFENLSPDVTL